MNTGLKPRPIPGIADVIDGVDWREQARNAIRRGHVEWHNTYFPNELPPQWAAHLEQVPWELNESGWRHMTFPTAIAVIRDCANCFSHPASGALVDMGRRFLEDDETHSRQRGVADGELLDALHKLKEEIECV